MEIQVLSRCSLILLPLSVVAASVVAAVASAWVPAP